MSLSRAENTVGCTTSLYYDSSAKLVWDIEGFDLAIPVRKNMTSGRLKVKCEASKITLEWQIRLAFVMSTNDFNISLHLCNPGKNLKVDCSYDISVGVPGLECITLSAQECYLYTATLRPTVFNNGFSIQVDSPNSMLTVSSEELATQREKLYPHGTLHITVDLRMYLKLATKEGAHGCFPSLINPVNTSDKCVASLRSSTKYSDVTIKCQEREFAVHKCVLGKSSVFDAMLDAGMKETYSNKIDISDVDPEAFELFLKSLYGEPFEVPTNHTELLELLNCAEKYDLKALKIACLLKMPRLLTLENAGELAVAAYRYCEDEEFRAFFRNYCYKWQSTLLKNSGYKQLFVANIEAFI